MYLQDTNTGMHDMVVACREKGDARHDVIDEAIRDKAEVSWNTEFFTSKSLTMVSGLCRLFDTIRLRLSSERV